MARAVLISAHCWAASLGLVAAVSVTPAQGASQTACSSKILNPDIRTVQQQVIAGAFYRELLLRFGKPLTCSVNVQDSSTELAYTFRHGPKLVATATAKVEFSEQRVESIHMDSSKAIALLKRAEFDSYQPLGCGISWTSGEEEAAAGGSSTHEIVYRGDVCNCQARLIYKDGYVVTLILRSAC